MPTSIFLRAKGVPLQHYVGSTEDLKRRLQKHQTTTNGYTAQRADWALHWYCAFPAGPAARDFEHDLKSGSTRAFTKRHL